MRRTTPRLWRDEQHGEAAPRLQLLQEIEDLRLDGDVERGGRLVEDEQIGLGRQRAGDQRPLAHATRQLVRIGPGDRGGLGDADLAQQLDGASQRPLARHAAVVDEAFADLRADPHRRVQHRERVLEHQRHARTAQLAPVLAFELQHILALEQDAAGRHLRLGRQQTHHGQRDRALARARLADHRQGPPFGDRQRDIAQRRDVAAERAVADGQVLDRERHGVRTLPMAPQARIEPLAQAVADQVDADDQQAHGEARRQRDPGRAVDELACLGDHEAPIGARRLRAEAEEAQRRAEQDGVGDAQAGLHDQRRPGVGQDFRGTGCRLGPRPAPGPPARSPRWRGRA